MQAAVYFGKEDVRVEERPKPTISDREVLVFSRSLAASKCQDPLFKTLSTEEHELRSIRLSPVGNAMLAWKAARTFARSFG